MSKPGVEEISQRLIEQLADPIREARWLENPNQPLEATLYTAPIWRIAEACLANPDRDTLFNKSTPNEPPTFEYDEDLWQKTRAEIKSKGVPNNVQSDLDPIDAIAAEVIISRVDRFGLILRICQEDPITVDFHSEMFDFHPEITKFDVQ